MSFKKFILIIAFAIVVIVTAIFIKNKYEEKNRKDVKIPILLYHNFVTTVPEKDEDNFNYINTPEGFEENIKVLLENGYTIISMKELNEAYDGKLELPTKPIAINFDDGYYSNYEYIYPILKKYNVKASIFIVTDNIGNEKNGIRYLTWEQCKEMENSGLIEIYSHSKRHIFYDRFPARTVRLDVVQSYKEIEKELGVKKFKAFSYPYGAHTIGTVMVLKLSEIDMQVYDLGINNFKHFNKDFVKRINVPCEMTGKEILQEIEK